MLFRENVPILPSLSPPPSPSPSPLSPLRSLLLVPLLWLSGPLQGCVDLDALRDEVICKRIKDGGCAPDATASSADARAGLDAAADADARVSADASPEAGAAAGSGGTSGGADRCDPDPCQGRSGHKCDPDTGACVCDHDCDPEGATRCTDGELSECARDEERCRRWVPKLDCPLGACADDGMSCAGCDNQCPTSGQGECSAGQLRVCVADSDGCLEWSNYASCNGGIACTDDSCDQEQGRCANTPDHALCTANATNPCMSDYCDKDKGCATTNTTEDCDDNDSCTENDVCAAGVCSGTLADRDGDTEPDCTDNCPDDELKTAPGTCGCGIPEDTADADTDGIINCLDPCPNDQCSTEGATTCIDATLSTCTADADGCLTWVETTCGHGYCWDATRCGQVITKDWGEGVACEPYAVVVDAVGNAFVAGRTNVGLDGNSMIGGAEDQWDAFLSKWNASGTRVWTMHWGSDDVEIAKGLAIDDSGYLVLVGDTQGDVSETNAGGYDIFAAMWPPTVDPGGSATPTWQTQGGTASIDFADSVSFGPGGDAFVAGATLGTFPDQTNAGDYDALLLRLSVTTGEIQWARQWGTSAKDFANAVAGNSGALFVAGELGHDPLDMATADMYVSKRDGNGIELWPRIFDYGARDYASAAAVDQGGNVILAGTTWFGGAASGVLLKVDSDAGDVWEEDGVGRGTAIATDAAGNVYLGSSFSGAIGKWSAAGQRLWIVGIGAQFRYVTGIAVAGDGTVVAVGHTDNFPNSLPFFIRLVPE